MSLLITRFAVGLQFPVGPFNESLMSCRKTDKFWVNLQHDPDNVALIEIDVTCQN